MDTKGALHVLELTKTLEARCEQIADRIKVGVLSERTLSAQRQCLLAMTVFLLSRFGLVELEETGVLGLKFSMSLNVLVLVSLLYALYQFLRFFSGAYVERRLSSIQYQDDRKSLKGHVEAWVAAWTEWRNKGSARIEEIKEKIDANKRHVQEADEQEKATNQKYQVELDELRARWDNAQREVDEFKDREDIEAARVLWRKAGDAGADWLAVEEARAGRSRQSETGHGRFRMWTTKAMSSWR
ncbi:MAG: hypothetical protein NVV62_08360 [Terricaulis sp.]|nr:hypothetical protein [Terricaulis sp.]